MSRCATASALVKQIVRSHAATMTFSGMLGAAIGVVMFANIGSHDARGSLAKWVALPGTAFLRVIKAIDLPLISTNIIVGCSGMLKLEFAGTIGLVTGCLYLFTSLLASAIGVSAYLILGPLFRSQHADKSWRQSSVALECADGLYVGMSVDGTVVCNNTNPSANAFPITVFGDSVLTEAAIPTQPGDIILSIIDNFTPDNIVASFATNNVLGVILISIAFGIAIVRIEPSGGQTRVIIADSIVQLRSALAWIASMVMRVAWLATISLVAGAILTAHDPWTSIANFFLLLLSAVVGYVFHSLIVIPLLLLAVTRTNPFVYLIHFRRACWEAFVSGEVEDALDASVSTAVEKGGVSGTVAGFVLPLGADINLDGSGVYFPLAVLFLGFVGGYSNDVTWGTFIIIALVSTGSAIGGLHVENGGLIMLLTIWTACFDGAHKPPLEIGYLLAVDWLFHRIIAVVNVITDVVVAKIVSATCDDSAFRDFHRRSLARSNRWASTRNLDLYMPELNKSSLAEVKYPEHNAGAKESPRDVDVEVDPLQAFDRERSRQWASSITKAASAGDVLSARSGSKHASLGPPPFIAVAMGDGASPSSATSRTERVEVMWPRAMAQRPSRVSQVATSRSPIWQQAQDSSSGATPRSTTVGDVVSSPSSFASAGNAMRAVRFSSSPSPTGAASPIPVAGGGLHIPVLSLAGNDDACGVAIDEDTDDSNDAPVVGRHSSGGGCPTSSPTAGSIASVDSTRNKGSLVLAAAKALAGSGYGLAVTISNPLAVSALTSRATALVRAPTVTRAEPTISTSKSNDVLNALNPLTALRAAGKATK